MSRATEFFHSKKYEISTKINNSSLKCIISQKQIKSKLKLWLDGSDYYEHRSIDETKTMLMSRVKELKRKLKWID